MSNTERIVMSPLAPHTQRGRMRDGKQLSDTMTAQQDRKCQGGVRPLTKPPQLALQHKKQRKKKDIFKVDSRCC